MNDIVQLTCKTCMYFHPGKAWHGASAVCMFTFPPYMGAMNQEVSEHDSCNLGVPDPERTADELAERILNEEAERRAQQARREAMTWDEKPLKDR